jgi:hypothetical protein
VEDKVKELTVPAAAVIDPRSVELVRVWAAGGKQHVSIATGIWADPAAWGVALVDLARHIAIAYAQTTALSQHEVLTRIKAGFDAEWSDATDTPRGSVAS